MNILIVLSNLSYRSGVTSVITNYLRFIDRKNNNFAVIYYDKTNTQSYEDELIKMGVRIFFLPRRFFVSKLKAFCKDWFGQFDIIHINDPYLAFCFSGIKKKLGVKKIIYHSHTTKFSDTKLKGVRNFFLSLPCRKQADYFFACSNLAGTKVFGKNFKKRGSIVYNAIDLSKFYFSSVARECIRGKYKFDDKATVVGHVGNMTPQKNHLFLIDIFFNYLSLDPDAVLLLLGDGYLKDKLIRKIKKRGLEKKVFFAGVVNNVNDYMSSMDKFLFPSLFEGLGIVMIEAQTNGLHCLHSDVVPIEALFNSSNNIAMPLKENAKEWAKKLKSLPSRENCISLEEDNYDIKKASDKLEQLYKAVLAR